MSGFDQNSGQNPGQKSGQKSGDDTRSGSTLVSRNAFVGGRRTSLRLEPAMWDAVAEICQREGMSLHELCGLVEARRQASSLTAAVRVFLLTYFRAAATEDGHASNGHGALFTARLKTPRAGAKGRVGAKGKATKKKE